METKICRYLVAASLLILFATQTTAAQAGDEPFVGEMIWVPYTFAPSGWAFCDGSLLPISGNEALFSLIGTTYGGNGVNSFALPDMRGRTMVDAGQGPYYTLGQAGGEANHTLTIGEIPAHNHTFQASTATGTANTPSSDRVYGQAASGYLYGPDPSASMAPQGTFGGVLSPHNNMMPYITLNCIIALEGVYPSRP